MKTIDHSSTLNIITQVLINGQYILQIFQLVGLWKRAASGQTLHYSRRIPQSFLYLAI